MRVRGGVVVLLAVVVAGLTVVGWGHVQRRDSGAFASVDRSGQRLSFALPRFAGGELTSEQLHGRPYVLNFYASWCIVCEQEMPDFERVARQVGGRVAIIGVNPQSHDTDVGQARLVAETAITYTTVRDRRDTLLRLFNTSGSLPTTVFVAASGAVVGVYNGLLTEGRIDRFIDGYFDVHLRPSTPDRTLFRSRLPSPP